MFKLVSNTERWETLYTSRQASARLRAFMPEEPIYDEGPIATRHWETIQVERLILRPYGDRPRMILLITEHKVGLEIGTRLLTALPEELERIATARSLAEVSSERLTLERYCKGLDDLLVGNATPSPTQVENRSANFSRFFLWPAAAVTLAAIFSLLYSAWRDVPPVKIEIEVLAKSLSTNLSFHSSLRTNVVAPEVHEILGPTLSILTNRLSEIFNQIPILGVPRNGESVVGWLILNSTNARSSSVRLPADAAVKRLGIRLQAVQIDSSQLIANPTLKISLSGGKTKQNSEVRLEEVSKESGVVFFRETEVKAKDEIENVTIELIDTAGSRNAPDRRGRLYLVTLIRKPD
jgi:hypothetical protein